MLQTHILTVLHCFGSKLDHGLRARSFCLPPQRRAWIKGWAGEQGQQERTLRIACEDEEEAEASRQLLSYIHSAGRTLPDGGCCSAERAGLDASVFVQATAGSTGLPQAAWHCFDAASTQACNFSFGWPCRRGRDYCAAGRGAKARC